MKHALPMVAIVGRQNVGKSTLFNSIVGERRAIVSPVGGTTRDRALARVAWRGVSFLLTDTGGVEERPASEIGAATRRQAERAVQTADTVCFIVDGKAGMTREDRAVASLLREARTPVLLAVNKLDGPRARRELPTEFFRLGFDRIVLVSAKTGIGVGDLLDEVLRSLPRRGVLQETREDINLVILGKPNVGKSSLVNRLVNEERVIVSPEPHTTRDAQDILFRFEDRRYRLVDTAGIRRRARRAAFLKKENETKLEQLSIHAALRSLERADIAAVVLDAQEPVTSQDRHLLRLVLESSASVVLVVNKWDLVPEKTTRTVLEAERIIRTEMPFLAWAPILFVSAKTGQRVFDLLRLCRRIMEARRRTIAPEALRTFVAKDIVPRWPGRTRAGRANRFPPLEQTGTEPPTFRIVVGANENMPTAYQRFLVNALRERFDFVGTPIRLAVERRLRR